MVSREIKTSTCYIGLQEKSLSVNQQQQKKSIHITMASSFSENSCKISKLDLQNALQLILWHMSCILMWWRETREGRRSSFSENELSAPFPSTPYSLHIHPLHRITTKQLILHPEWQESCIGYFAGPKPWNHYTMHGRLTPKKRILYSCGLLKWS